MPRFQASPSVKLARPRPCTPSPPTDFERRGHEASEDVYSVAYHYTNSQDLQEEFCTAVVRPLMDGFGFRNDEVQKIDFRVEGINGPICCPKVDLVSKKNKARSLMKNIEQRAVVYCGHYWIEEHEQVLARTAKKAISTGSFAPPEFPTHASPCCMRVRVVRLLPILRLPRARRGSVVLVAGLGRRSPAGGRAFFPSLLILALPSRLSPPYPMPRGRPRDARLLRGPSR